MASTDNSPGFHIKHFGTYIDFISVIIGCAPDNFTHEDYLTEEQQLNLDRAFQVLREKFPLAVERVVDRSVLPRARELIETSYAAYKGGEDIEGAHLIQEFRALILASIKPRPVE